MEVNFPTSREAFRRHSGYDFPYSDSDSENDEESSPSQNHDNNNNKNEKIHEDGEDGRSTTDESDGSFLGWPTSKQSTTTNSDDDSLGNYQDGNKTTITNTNDNDDQDQANIANLLSEKRNGGIAPSGNAAGEDNNDDVGMRKSTNSSTLYQSEGSLSGYHGEGSDHMSNTPRGHDHDDAALEFQQQRRKSMGSQSRRNSKDYVIPMDQEEEDSTIDSREDPLVLLPSKSADDLTCMEVPEMESSDDDEKRGGRNLMMLQKNSNNTNGIVRGDDDDDDDDDKSTGSFDVTVPTKRGTDHHNNNDNRPANADIMGSSSSKDSGNRQRHRPPPPLDESDGSMRSAEVLRELRISLRGKSRSSQSSLLELMEEEEEKRGGDGEEKGVEGEHHVVPPLRQSLLRRSTTSSTASSKLRNSELLKSLQVTLLKQAETMASMDHTEDEKKAPDDKAPVVPKKTIAEPIVSWGDTGTSDAGDSSLQDRDNDGFYPSLKRSNTNLSSSGLGHAGWASTGAGWNSISRSGSANLKASLDTSSKASFCSSLKASQQDSYGPVNGQVYEDFGTRPQKLGKQSSMEGESGVDEHNRNNLLMIMMEEEYDPKKPWRKAPAGGSSPGNDATARGFANGATLNRGRSAPQHQFSGGGGTGAGGIVNNARRRDSRITSRSSFTSDMSFGEILQEMHAAHPPATSALDASERPHDEEGDDATQLSPMVEEEERTNGTSSLSASTKKKRRRRTMSDGDDDTALRTSRISEVTSALSDGDCSELTELRQAQDVLFPVPESFSTRDGEEEGGGDNVSERSGISGRSGNAKDGASRDALDVTLSKSSAPTRLSALDIVQEEQLPHHDQVSPSSESMPIAKKMDQRDRQLDLKKDSLLFTLDDLPTSSMSDLKKSKGFGKDDDSVSYSDIDAVEQTEKLICPSIKMCMTVRDSVIEREFATETMRDVEYGDTKPNEAMSLGMFLNPTGDADGNLYDPMMGGNPHHNTDNDSDDDSTSRSKSTQRAGSFIKKAVGNQTKKLDSKATKKLRRKNKRLWKFCVWNCRKITMCLILGLCVLAGIAALAWWGATKVTGKGNGGGNENDQQEVPPENVGIGSKQDSVAPTGLEGKVPPPVEGSIHQPSQYPSSSPSLRGFHHGNSSWPPSYISSSSSAPAPGLLTISSNNITSTPIYSYTNSKEDQSTYPSFASSISPSPSSSASDILAISSSQNNVSVYPSYSPSPSMNSSIVASVYPSSSPQFNASSSVAPTLSNTSSSEPPLINSTSAESPYPSSSSLNNTYDLSTPSNASSIQVPSFNSTNATSSPYPSISTSSNISHIDPLLSNTPSIELPLLNSTSDILQNPSSSPSSNKSNVAPTSSNMSSVELPLMNSSGVVLQKPSSSPSNDTLSIDTSLSNTSSIQLPSMNSTLKNPTSSPSSNTPYVTATASNLSSIEFPLMNSTSDPSLSPTRLNPTSLSPTRLNPTSLTPTRLNPTSLSPTRLTPTSLTPTSLSPTRLNPTSSSPTSLTPTRLTPTSSSPTSLSPTRLNPTSSDPTINPSSIASLLSNVPSRIIPSKEPIDVALPNPSLSPSSNATPIEPAMSNSPSAEAPFLYSTNATSPYPSITTSNYTTSIEPPLNNTSSTESPFFNSTSNTPTSAPVAEVDQPSQSVPPISDVLPVYESIQEIRGMKELEYAGASVSINPTGEFIVAGFREANGPVHEKSGLVRVYRLTGDNTYSPFGLDSMFGTATGDEFGSSVFISNDGKRVAVGARSSSLLPDRLKNGQATVFEYSETSNLWVPLGSTIQGSQSKERLGFSISMSGNGQRVAVGSPGTGSASVYDYDGFDWVLLSGDIISSEDVRDRTGFSVSLSGDGGTLAVGAFYASKDNLIKSGSVSLYKLDSVSLVKHGQTLMGSADGDRFGYSVSLSGDGHRLIVGSNGFNSGNVTKTGLCEIFELREQNNWILSGALVGIEENERVGSHVSMSNIGSVASCSKYTFSDGITKGAVTVLRENDIEEWSVVETILSSQENSPSFGASVSLSQDGNTIVAGAPSYNSSTGFFELFAARVDLANTITR